MTNNPSPPTQDDFWKEFCEQLAERVRELEKQLARLKPLEGEAYAKQQMKNITASSNVPAAQKAQEVLNRGSYPFLFHLVLEVDQEEINCYSSEFDALLDDYRDFVRSHPLVFSIMSLMPRGDDLVEHIKKNSK